jgi:hypothetical protein
VAGVRQRGYALTGYRGGAAAESIPADKFGSRPTTAPVSFGELVLQVAGKNELVAWMRTAKNEGGLGMRDRQ